MGAHDLILTVAADVRFLSNEWDQRVDDDSLRRSSSVLRRLLVENDLQKAWKAAGWAKEPLIRATSLQPLLKRVPIDKIDFATAGGATHGGLMLSGIRSLRAILSDHDLSAIRAEEEQTIGLHAFVNSPCIVARGLAISRTTVVQYVANKLGGAHFDERRSMADIERGFSILDDLSSTLRLGSKDAVYFELLSIGQRLVASPDVQRIASIVP